MANTLANLRACVPEFNPDSLIDEGSNTDKRWKQWLENFECCLEFEGVTDQPNEKSKKRAALLAIGGQQLRDLLKTLSPTDDTYLEARNALNTHFTAKKNLTAERYKFFCAKPLGTEETHDHWITRLRTMVKDCEFDKMDDDEAIKLVVTLNTTSDKLQAAIIQKDMDLTKVIAVAKSMELAQREVRFMKNNPMIDSPTLDAIKGHEQEKNTRDDNKPNGYPRHNHSRWRKSRTIELCRYCGERMPHTTQCKARNATCRSCNKRGHFAKVCESRTAKDTETDEITAQPQSPLRNPPSIALDKVTTSRHPAHSYPDAHTTVLINKQPVQMKIDSGAEANIITENTFLQLKPQPTLTKTKVTLTPYGSPPLPVLGEFYTTIRANTRSINTNIYVVRGPAHHNLLSRYSAFDLEILHISVNNENLTINIHDVENSEQQRHNDRPDAEHLSYHDMAERLTSLETSAKWMKNNKGSSQKNTIDRITEHHSTVFQGIGKHKFRQVKLIIDEEVKPIIQPQRKVPFAKRPQLDTIINELEDAGVIEQVEGPTDWISNLVLTPKADPTQIRMNVDMTTANTAIKRTRHVIPTLEELRYELNGARHFTKLDMRHGYMQLELDPASRPITTFYTHQGLRRSRRLTFGINSAAEVFHEEIHQTLADIPNVKNIYDDIIVYGATSTEHNLALCQVLQRLEDCGLTLNKDKCVFDQPKINFFGVIFSSDGLSPAPDKIKALKEATLPQTAAEVRSFLGMANFSSYFIPNYSITTAPLRALTKKNAIFEWSKECDEAFHKISTALAQEPVMAYYDPVAETKLIVDGSKKTGLASILTQRDPKTNQYRVVRYDSRPTTPQEQRYSQIEIESAALEFGILRNHIYLYGLQTFTVVTDHRPLLPLYQSYKKAPPSRILKHKLRTQGYNYKLTYEPGSSNPADYLSRHPTAKIAADAITHTVETELFVDNIITHMLPDPITKAELQKETRKDQDMQILQKAITNGNIPKEHRVQLAPYTHIFSELTTSDDLILRGPRIVVPTALRTRAVKIAHEGHQGLVKTKQYLRDKLWFPGINDHVNNAIEACIPCQAATNTSQAEPQKMTDLPDGPWEHVRADLFGPLPNTQYVLVVQCLYSCYPAVEIVTLTSANAVIPAMDRILTDFGVPYQLGTDNGPPFFGHKFKEFSRKMGFRHIRVTPYAPWANGTVEHFMRNIGKVLKTAKIENKDWKAALLTFLKAYRATPHSTTGFAPATLLFNGRKYNTQLPDRTHDKKNIYTQEVRHNDEVRKNNIKQRADNRRHAKQLQLKVGDTVLCRQQQGGKTTTPYNPTPYIITSIKGSQVAARNDTHSITRHITFFKKLHTVPPTTPRLSPNKALDIDITDEEHTDADFSESSDEEDTIPYREEPGLSSEEEEGEQDQRPQRQKRLPARYRDN